MANSFHITKLTSILKNAPVIWVYPEDLDNMHQVEPDKLVDPSSNWDINNRKFSSNIVFNGFKRHLEGSAWSDTEFYAFHIRKYGENWLGLKKFDRWDDMIKDIVSYGYTHRSIKDPIDNYMSIFIGRNGRMYIYNGIHRYCCCLLSPIRQKIPVKVLMRHTQWQEFKSSCIKYQKRVGKLYSQLPHPDLESIPYHFNNDRADIIAKNSLFSAGTTLTDIGSHWGTVSSVLTQHGFDVTSIEKVSAHFSKLKKLSQLSDRTFTAINGDFINYKDKANILVMLNIAHHFTPDPKELFKFLSNHKYSEIFYQSHSITDKWAKVISPREYLRMIMDASDMHNAFEIHNISGRKLWHLTR